MVAYAEVALRLWIVFAGRRPRLGRSMRMRGAEGLAWSGLGKTSWPDQDPQRVCRAHSYRAAVASLLCLGGGGDFRSAPRQFAAG